MTTHAERGATVGDAPAGPLIHIGYHKTATSWLQKFLFNNPEAGFAWDGKAPDSPVNRLVTVHPDRVVVDRDGVPDDLSEAARYALFRRPST